MPRRSRPFILLILALVSGGVAAWVALRYLREQAMPLMAEAPKAKVVVASRPLPIGAVVGPADVKLVDWSGGALPGGALARPADAVGRGLIVPVQENEPLLDGKLAAAGAGGGLPVIIQPGMRAFSVAVDQVVGVAGFVLPRTRVDVLLTLTGAGNREAATRILLQNVRTLAAGHSIQQDKNGRPQEVPVVTLLVTPEQAETLALAAGQGRIQLALRNTMDSLNVRTDGTRLSGLMGGSSDRSPAPRRRPRTAARAPEPAGPAPATVEVYRGGQRTLERFGP